MNIIQVFFVEFRVSKGRKTFLFVMEALYREQFILIYMTDFFISCSLKFRSLIF